MMMDQVHIQPGTVSGSVRIPSSKSLCHRAIICAALAEGCSEIRNISVSADIEATIQIMKQLGAEAYWKEDVLIVKGVGDQRFHGENVDIFCNESGSTLRFIIPIAAVLGVKARYTGAGRLAERPLTSYYEIMEAYGWRYTREREDRHLPLVIEDPWQAGVFKVAGNISSQFITGLLLALPLLKEDSVIEITTELESRPYVDLTLDMMKQFGVTVQNEGYRRFVIPGGQTYKAQDYTAEGDYSQAAFFLTAGAVTADAPLRLLGMNPESHQGDQVILWILKQMGASFFWDTNGDLVIERAKMLRNITVDASQCPDLVPIVAVLGAYSEGTMQIIRAERLRIKESDRLAAVAAELTRNGVFVEETEDGLIIHSHFGKKYPGGEADSWNDHRIAMASAVLALGTETGIRLKGAGSVRKSWPAFWRDFESIGGAIHEW